MNSMSNADWWRGCGRSIRSIPVHFRTRPATAAATLPASSASLGHIASLGVDAIWLSPFFKSPMADMGYDVSDYCAVDPMFGTIEDFDALVAEAHRLGLKIIIDQVLSHTSDQHPWFVESRAEPGQPKGRLVCLGRSQAGWHRAEQLAFGFRRSGLGMGFGRASSITCTISSPRSPISTSTIRKSRTRCLRRCGSGWSAASTASGSIRSTTTFMTAGCATTRRSPRGKASDDPRHQPLRLSGPSLRQDAAGEPRLPEAVPRAARWVWRSRVGRRGGRWRALAPNRRRLYGRRRQAAHVLHLRPARPEFSAGAYPRLRRAFETAVADGWVCWAFSNHDVMRHVVALDAARRRSGRCRQIRDHAARLPARLDLPLPGRGTWPAGGRARLRGSARSLRHPLLARLQGQGRLPNADGLGGGKDKWRLLDRQAVAACARQSSCASSRYAKRRRCVHPRHYRAVLAFRKKHPALIDGADRVSGCRRRRAGVHRGRGADEKRCSAPSTSRPKRREWTLPENLGRLVNSVSRSGHCSRRIRPCMPGLGVFFAQIEQQRARRRFVIGISASCRAAWPLCPHQQRVRLELPQSAGEHSNNCHLKRPKVSLASRKYRSCRPNLL